MNIGKERILEEKIDGEIVLEELGWLGRRRGWERRRGRMEEGMGKKEEEQKRMEYKYPD
jgi:hypothetical protein